MIRGDHVYLRPSERDDLPLFVRWLGDADVARNLVVRAPMSMPMEERWFDRMLETQGRTSHHFVICLLADNRPIGTAALHDVTERHGTADFGIAIGEKDEWDHGYGTDALRAICAFGFEELRLERIGLQVYDGNDRARRAYEKAGFTHEATLRHAHYADGGFEDVHVMSLLRDEWRALRATKTGAD